MFHKMLKTCRLFTFLLTASPNSIPVTLTKSGIMTAATRNIINNFIQYFSAEQDFKRRYFYYLKGRSKVRVVNKLLKLKQICLQS